MANSVAKADPVLPGLLPAADEVEAILRSISVDMEGRTPVISRFPTKDETRALQVRNVALARAVEAAVMRTVDLQEAKAAIAVTLYGFPQMRSEGDDLVRAYLLVLQKYPLFAIKDACSAVSDGRIKNQDDRYPPTSPQMSKAAAESVERIARERIKIERILTARTVMRPKDEPGAKERIMASLKDFHGRMAPAEGVMGADERARVADRQRRENERAVIAEWDRLGLAPRRRSDGAVMSVGLCKSLGLLVEFKDGRNGTRLVPKEEIGHGEG